jgi:hypothetical protein
MRYFIASILALSCAAFSSDNSAIVGTMRAARPDGMIITRVVSRQDVIVVRAGSGGPTYSLETKNGEVIVPAATLGKLAMTKPSLSGAVKAMQATDWAGNSLSASALLVAM